MSGPADEGEGWPALLDGEPCAPGAAALPLDDPAVQLGVGLFETLALRGGRPRLVDAHLERLAGAARDLGFALPARAALAADLERLAGLLPTPDAALRVTVSPRARGGPRRWVTARPLPATPERVVLWPAGPRVRTGDRLERVKHTGRLAKVLLRELARERGAFDALLATTDGDLVAATVANLWIVLDGRLRTPPVERGCLPGVARAALLADPEPPFPLDVAPIAPADLARAEEVLLTNSLHGPLGVDAVLGGRGDLPGAGGAAAAALRRRFAALGG